MSAQHREAPGPGGKVAVSATGLPCHPDLVMQESGIKTNQGGTTEERREQQRQMRQARTRQSPGKQITR